MTSMVLAVRAPAAGLRRVAHWARTRVRLVDSERPGWSFADVAEPNQTALERVAEEVSHVAPAVLLVVGELRTGVQLWHGGVAVTRLGWTSGEVNRLSPDHAEAVAATFARVLGIDAGPVARVLREESRPDRAWPALLAAALVPVPPHFGRHRTGPLTSDRVSEEPRHGILDSMVRDVQGI